MPNKIARYEELFSHKDDRRDLVEITNSDVDFPIVQVKYMDMKQDSLLGSHYHHENYFEIYTAPSGNVVFLVEDMKTLDNELIELEPGFRLIIPPLVPHAAVARKDSFLIGMTSQKYVSEEVNSVPYTFKGLNIPKEFIRNF